MQKSHAHLDDQNLYGPFPYCRAARSQALEAPPLVSDRGKPTGGMSAAWPFALEKEMEKRQPTGDEGE
jgi:hypothetical protein